MKLREFWRFVLEREAIRHRKRLGADPPYTEDARLKSYWFPNICRRHDPTFDWWQKQVAGIVRNQEDEKLLRATIAYYLFSKPETVLQILPIIMDAWDSHRVLQVLGGQRHLFNRKHLGALPASLGEVCMIMDYVPSTVPYLVGPDLELSTDAISMIRGIGRVLAFEIAYARHFALGGHNPTWAEPTPNAVRGAAIVLDKELGPYRQDSRRITLDLILTLKEEEGGSMNWGVPDAQRALELFYVYARDRNPPRRYQWN